jgi:hypothetical protein
MAQSWDGPEVWLTFGTGIRVSLVNNRIGKAVLVEKVGKSGVWGQNREVKHRVFFSANDFKSAVDALERAVAVAKASAAYQEDAEAAKGAVPAPAAPPRS